MGNLLAGMSPTNNGGKKSLFSGPGSTLGIITLGGIIVGGGVILYRILPYLIELVDNAATLVTKLLYLGGMCAIGFVVVYLLLDPKFRRRMGILYMMFMKWLTGLVVQIDPIAIIEGAIEKMKMSIQKMELNMGKLNGTKMKLKRKIEEKKDQMEKSLNSAKAARKMGKNDLATVEERQAVRLQGTVNTAIDLYNSAEKWYNTLSKLAEMAKLTVMDTENEVNAKKEEYQMVKEAHKSFKSAMSVLSGDPDELALFNQALEVMQNDVMNKLGEMDRVINTSGGFIDKLDVENEMYAIKGGDLIKQYEQCGIDALFKKFETLPSGKALQKLPPHQTYQTLNFNQGQIIDVQPIEENSNPSSKYFEE